MTDTAPGAYIVLFVPRRMEQGQALTAELFCLGGVEPVRARALTRLDQDAGLWRAMVLDAHSGQVVGLVTRAAPHWEMPLSLGRESFAAH